VLACFEYTRSPIMQTAFQGFFTPWSSPSSSSLGSSLFASSRFSSSLVSSSSACSSRFSPALSSSCSFFSWASSLLASFVSGVAGVGAPSVEDSTTGSLDADSSGNYSISSSYKLRRSAYLQQHGPAFHGRVLYLHFRFCLLLHLVLLLVFPPCLSSPRTSSFSF
jgi:hypothetical protein